MNPPRGPAGDDEAAWYGFLSLHAKITRRLDALLAASHGMTLTEFEVLLKLDLAGGTLRMSDLAEAALLSRSGLTGIVDDLEPQGLVRRDTDEADGRVLLASLTTAGRGRLEAARAEHRANVHELFLDAMTPAQRRALGEIWAAIDDRLPSDLDRPSPRRAPRRRRRAAR